ncbi:DUF2934 domain-containing protein [Parvibaculum sedimenti]|uniref:DUF2934 domain-containing protein n=1 Tax=Parvibaculum sedimenti TaxID=2608632 RepID=A0A6N6VG92_9HYPH|nr:DUF2934 domain-containing protein [Parvibaculum sedimenti]KAB7739726.1 DUF2934 domain-containing protein [Parvibaculum sedimenti]
MAYYDTFDISEEAIQLRSYLIWVAEGCPDGADIEHWLRAEAELAWERRPASVQTKLTAYVAPRIPISTPPCRSTAARLFLQRGSASVSVARQ